MRSAVCSNVRNRSARPRLRALGYREVVEHIAGQRDLAETIALVQLHTRQFAKRQMTWFRSLSECRRVPMTPAADASKIANEIAAAGSLLA